MGMIPPSSISPDPVVSVILPTWNRAELLPRAIASVQGQTTESWELLVVDDGSTDATAAVVSRIAAADPRIRLLPRLHAGPSAARNHGLAMATGRYMAFIDSDDEWLPGHLAPRITTMDSLPDLGLLHGGVVVHGPPGADVVPDLHDRSRMIPIAECIVGGTFFARAGVIEAAGGWRDGYGEDHDLFHRIIGIAQALCVDHATYIYHRDVGDSRCDRAME